jgi:beta-lactamase regulating signal transducer with metallopeptidase domain
MISVFAETAMEATVLVGISLVGLLALRRAPARLRSLVLGIALAGTLVLPAVSWLLPEIAVPVPWLTRAETSRSSADVPVPAPASVESTPSAVPTTALPVGYSPGPVEPAGLPSIHPSTLCLAVWLVGALAVLAHLAVGWWRALSLVRTSHPIDPDSEIAERWLGCRRRLPRLRARLRLSSGLSTPATWGCLRPVVLMPDSAAAWDPDAVEVALLHEAVHVTRGDWLVRTSARLACAVYWFNPLIWWATRRLAIEQEHACDDAIVANGARPSIYASHLLAIAHRATPRPAALAAALGMANRSQLEERVMSILSDCPSRRVSLTATAVVAVLSLALVPTIAAIAPSAAPRAHIAATNGQAPSAAPAPAAPPAPEPAAAPAPVHPAPDAPPAPHAPAVSPELRALSERILELEERIEATVEDAEWSRELEQITEQMAPHRAHIEALVEQIEPYTAEIERLSERVSAEVTAEIDRAMDAELEAEIARMSAEIARMGAEIAASVAADAEQLHGDELRATVAQHQAEISQRAEELQRRLEDLVQPRIEATQRLQEERMAELEARIAELTAEMEPSTERLRDLELDMEPIREQMERMERDLEPLTAEIERLSEQLEAELGAEIRSRISTHLGPLLGPAAPVDEAVARILDEARIQLNDDRIRLRTHQSEVEAILGDLLADDRTGTRDAFDAAVARAAETIHRIDLQL